MSRTAVASILALYFVAALAFAAFVEMQSRVLAVPAVVIGSIGGKAIAVFAVAGIIPLVVWAFFRFKAARAKGPLVLWASLGVILAFLGYRSQQADQRRDIEDFTNLTMTEPQRAEALRSGTQACAKTQGARLVSRQMLTQQQLAPYCQCFVNQMFAAMTREERRHLAETGKPPDGIQPKVDQAAAACLTTVQSTKPNPFDQFDKDKDEWEDVPNRK